MSGFHCVTFFGEDAVRPRSLLSSMCICACARGAVAFEHGVLVFRSLFWALSLCFPLLSVLYRLASCRCQYGSWPCVHVDAFPAAVVTMFRRCVARDLVLSLSQALTVWLSLIPLWVQRFVFRSLGSHRCRCRSQCFCLCPLSGSRSSCV